VPASLRSGCCREGRRRKHASKRRARWRTWERAIYTRRRCRRGRRCRRRRGRRWSRCRSRPHGAAGTVRGPPTDTAESIVRRWHLSAVTLVGREAIVGGARAVRVAALVQVTRVVGAVWVRDWSAGIGHGLAAARCPAPRTAAQGQVGEQRQEVCEEEACRGPSTTARECHDRMGDECLV